MQSNVASPLWIVDSSVSHHFCNNRDNFSAYVDDPLSINTGNGSIESPGYDVVNLCIKKSKGDYKPLHLSNVGYMLSSYFNTIFEDILKQCNVSWHSEHQMFVHLPSGVEFA